MYVAQESPPRRGNAQTLERGRSLFRKNCAACHGWNAEGTTPDWQKRDENGQYPPPPLNGSAHTWHHPVPVLYRIIRDGTADMGGSMPAWAEKLSDDEMLMIIQWITSLWPDELYDIWNQRNTESQ